jgi:hypothetical protein
VYGLHLNLRDPLNTHDIEVEGSYSPDRRLQAGESWHGRLTYSYKQWQLVSKYNDADFYDLFGPTKSSRKGYSVGLTYRGTLAQDDPKFLGYRISVVRYGDLTKLPEFQNITTSFDRFWSVTTAASYRNQEASLGAVDYEKGITIRLTSENKFVNDRAFSRTWLDFDLGSPVLMHHSSVWLRNSIGYSPNNRFEPLANFYFGAFGNNWVDNQFEKRYRESFSFPGIGLDEAGGRNYLRSTLEWNLPPIRFRQLGGPSYYITWARPSVFFSGLTTNFDALTWRNRLASLGGQIDFRIVFLSHLSMTLSLGQAWAFPEHQRPVHEFMMSLKVL